jgi:hypothetical protein
MFRHDGVQSVSISKYQVNFFLYPAFNDDLSAIFESLTKIIKVLLSSPKTKWQENSHTERDFYLVTTFEVEPETALVEQVDQGQ